MEKDNPFTEEEEKVMKSICDVYKGFNELERMHPMEMQEVTQAIHQLQSMLSHRALKRMYPNYFT